MAPNRRRKADETEIERAIHQGFVFKPERTSSQSGCKVKTKARKKGYITGAHGSASARKKADIRRAKNNRRK